MSETLKQLLGWKKIAALLFVVVAVLIIIAAFRSSHAPEQLTHFNDGNIVWGSRQDADITKSVDKKQLAAQEISYLDFEDPDVTSGAFYLGLKGASDIGHLRSHPDSLLCMQLLAFLSQDVDEKQYALKNIKATSIYSQVVYYE